MIATFHVHFILYIFFYFDSKDGAGWLNELGRWILQLIQAYHQYGVGLCPAL